MTQEQIDQVKKALTEAYSRTIYYSSDHPIRRQFESAVDILAVEKPQESAPAQDGLREATQSLIDEAEGFCIDTSTTRKILAAHNEKYVRRYPMEMGTMRLGDIDDLKRAVDIARQALARDGVKE